MHKIWDMTKSGRIMEQYYDNSGKHMANSWKKWETHETILWENHEAHGKSWKQWNSWNIEGTSKLWEKHENCATIRVEVGTFPALVHSVYGNIVNIQRNSLQQWKGVLSSFSFRPILRFWHGTWVLWIGSADSFWTKYIYWLYSSNKSNLESSSTHIPQVLGESRKPN